jgi:hypothetical protein
VPEKRLIAAATRFKEAWEGIGSGGTLTDLDIIEMHGAALGLIQATDTSSLEEALAVLRQYEDE